ncbi:MAG: type II toxin-antitoxin system RelE/ParE family toxin [Actinomycetota bacterium]
MVAPGGTPTPLGLAGERPSCHPRLITLSLSPVATRSWEVEFHPACEAWADDLPQADGEALLAAIRVLRAEGPALGRPLVDRIKGSRHANMKELRPGSTGRTEVRVLFAFDRQRRAVLLVGGDKIEDWKGWYKENVSIADDRFDEHQARIQRAMAREKAAKGEDRRRKRGRKR